MRAIAGLPYLWRLVQGAVLVTIVLLGAYSVFASESRAVPQQPVQFSHQLILRGENLLVAPGVHPLVAGFERLAAYLGQGRALVHVTDEFEDVPAPQTAEGWRLKVAVTRDAVRDYESASLRLTRKDAGYIMLPVLDQHSSQLSSRSQLLWPVFGPSQLAGPTMRNIQPSSPGR
jgi:hypothetical protein